MKKNEEKEKEEEALEETKKISDKEEGDGNESPEKVVEGDPSGVDDPKKIVSENNTDSSDKNNGGASRVKRRARGWNQERQVKQVRQGTQAGKKEDLSAASNNVFDGAISQNEADEKSTSGEKYRKNLAEEVFATADKPKEDADRKRVADTEQRRKEPSVGGSMEDYYDEDKPSDGVQKGDKEKYTADEPHFVNINELNSNAAETPNAPVAQGEVNTPATTTTATPAPTTDTQAQAAPAPQNPTTDTTSAVAPPVNNPLPNPAPNTDLADKVNTGYTDLAGKSNANSAWVSAAKETQNKQGTKQTASQTTEQGVLREAAKQQYDKLEQQRASLQNQYADLQAKYNIEPKGDIEKRLYEQKVQELKAKHPDMDDKRVERKAQRSAKKEAEREHEYRKEALYRELDPDYESDKAYRREQNIKSIFAGITDLVRMGGKAVVAHYGGTVLPFKSLTDGAIEDKRVSDQQRKQLKQIYAKMAQGRLDSIKEQMQALEKQQLDIIKSEASYDKVKNTRGAENNQTLSINETDKFSKGTTPGSTSNDRVLENFEAKEKIKDKRFELPSTTPGKSYKIDFTTLNQGYNKLFSDFERYMKLREENGRYIDEDGKPVKWVNLDGIMRSIQGDDGDGSKRGYAVNEKAVAIIDELKAKAKKGDKEAQRILDEYIKFMNDATGENYGGAGSTGGNSGGGATVANVFGSSNGGGNQNLNNF